MKIKNTKIRIFFYFIKCKNFCNILRINDWVCVFFCFLTEEAVFSWNIFFRDISFLKSENFFLNFSNKSIKFLTNFHHYCFPYASYRAVVHKNPSSSSRMSKYLKCQNINTKSYEFVNSKIKNFEYTKLQKYENTKILISISYSIIWKNFCKNFEKSYFSKKRFFEVFDQQA